MAVFSRGFHGRRDHDDALPPGQYLTRDFPVLSAGPTPLIPHDKWTLTITTETGAHQAWNWAQFIALPSEEPTVDIHCVTRWSKLGTAWRRVSLDTLFADIDTAADFAMVHSYGSYTTNIPLEDLSTANPGSPTSARASRCNQSTAGRPAFSSRICTSGSQPNGCAASS